MGLPTENQVQALAKAAPQLGQVSIQWPIKLTPKAPFHIGVAALVFVSPHVLSPADDVAKFGIVNPPSGSVGPGPSASHEPPYDGAQVVAWFRPPELNREYNVEFNCEGAFPTGNIFVLERPDGSEDTTNVSGTGAAMGVALSSNIPAQESKWFKVGVRSSKYWRFVSCEISILPA